MKNISIKELKAECLAQTQKYHKQEIYDTSFCFEIFRRFFEDSSDQALAALYAIYKPYIRHWVRNHKNFPALGAEEEEVVLDSMSHFIFALRRHPFSRFTSIAALLAYWRICVHSVIMLQWRKNERRKTLEHASWQEPEEPSIEKGLLNTEVWERIRQVLTKEEDQLLARLIFLYNMKPRQIVKEYPGIWNDSDLIRVAQQRIKRILERDPVLYELLTSATNPGV